MEPSSTVSPEADVILKIFLALAGLGGTFFLGWWGRTRWDRNEKHRDKVIALHEELVALTVDLERAMIPLIQLQHEYKPTHVREEVYAGVDKAMMAIGEMIARRTLYASDDVSTSYRELRQRVRDLQVCIGQGNRPGADPLPPAEIRSFAKDYANYLDRYAIFRAELMVPVLKGRPA
jgi:hypothetical protein